MNAVVKIHGKEYKTVSGRVAEFREQFPDWTISTSIVLADEEKVIVKAEIVDDQGRIISVGHAEEYRNASRINSTSALENAETSAIGRALAFHLYAGSEIASADEVSDAIIKQNVKAVTDEMVKTANVMREHFTTIYAVKEALMNDDYSFAAEALNELTQEEKQAIWVAPSKGGMFTTEERKQLKSPEFHEAQKIYLENK